MEQIGSVAAYIPYMTCPGNREVHHNISYKEYRSRFVMPVKPHNSGELYYSFNYGIIHFVSLNVEVYYKDGGDINNVTSMFYWFKRDLESVDRKVTPWILVFGHRHSAIVIFLTKNKSKIKMRSFFKTYHF